MDQMTTWDIGQKIIPKKSTLFGNLEVIVVNNSIDMETHHSLMKFLNIYNSNLYSQYNEHAEFLVRFPEIVAENKYNEGIQDVIKPLAEYWDTVIIPNMNEHLSVFDNSEFCITPDFII